MAPVIARSLTEYFASEENNRRLDHLMEYLNIKKEEKKEEQIFQGMNFRDHGKCRSILQTAPRRKSLSNLWEERLRDL